jgi:protein-disulfide isomerase
MYDERVQRTQITADDWILGRPDAPITLLEYGDFECPYCAMARPVLEGLVAEYPDAIRLVYRHFPITTTHSHAFIAAEAAEAAGAQGEFWEMHDMLFTHQQQLEYENLRWYAEELDLDVARFDQEMRAHTYQDEVRQDFRRGVQDGANGTPTIFINGLRYDGPRDRMSILATITALMPARGRERGAPAW